MPVLDDFPNEILLNVLSNLRSSSLCNVVRVNWHLNILATPIMYKFVNVRDDPAKYEENRRLRKFLRSIVTKPILATYVRSICLPGDLSHPQLPARGLKIHQLAADRQLFSAAARNSGYNETHLGGMFAYDGREAQIILLSYLLPNLYSVYAHDLWTNRVLYQWLQSTMRMKRRAFPSGLRNVEKYSIEPRTDGFFHTVFAMSIQDAIPVMMLPNIRKMNAGCVYGQKGTFRRMDSMFYGQSSLEELSLSFKHDRFETLQHFFHFPSALKSFEAFLNGPRQICNVRGLCLALRPQRETLQKLSLVDCDVASASRKDNQMALCYSIGSFLSIITALETLKVSLHVLVSANANAYERLWACIPGGLKVLVTEMRKDYEGYCAQLEEVAANPKGIKSITIGAWPAGEHWNFDRVREAFKKADINLTIQYFPSSENAYCPQCELSHS